MYLNDDFYAKFVQKKGASGFFWVSQLFSYIIYGLYLYIPLILMKKVMRYCAVMILENYILFIYYYFL